MMNIVLDYPSPNRVGPPVIDAEIEELISYDEACLQRSNVSTMLYTLIRQHPVPGLFQSDTHAAQTVPGMIIQYLFYE